MKIAQIAGFLGSGKTTLLIELARELGRRGVRAAIVVNDVGEVSVDARTLDDFGLKARQLPDGCICCQIAGELADTLTLLYRSFQPELVLVEPTGVAQPWKVKRASEYSEGGAPTAISHAPVITLLDAARIDLLLRAVRRPVETQVREADIIAINKVDVAATDALARAREFARAVNPQARIIETSALQAQGVEALVEAILNEQSSRYDDRRAQALAERSRR
ncbi:MAG: GTP-binding protein [Anaerolineae bacterium]